MVVYRAVECTVLYQSCTLMPRMTEHHIHDAFSLCVVVLCSNRQATCNACMVAVPSKLKKLAGRQGGSRLLVHVWQLYWLVIITILPHIVLDRAGRAKSGVGKGAILYAFITSSTSE
jgi:hypothetical protein